MLKLDSLRATILAAVPRLAADPAQVIVMTGDDNPQKQAALLRAGANDLVEKPIEERLLVTKLLFQLA